MAKPRISVTRENRSGRNVIFHDNQTGAEMTRTSFVKRIERGLYPDYHVRVINDVKTPVSNPDRRSNNNLG